MPLYNFENHRTTDQLAEMQRLDGLGICLFCPGPDAGAGELLHRTKAWTVRANKYPYKGTKFHLLLVPDTHVDDIALLPGPERDDFWDALQWARESYRLSYYALAVRCGDCRFTSGTIEHVHVHVVVGDVEAPGHEPVRFKLSSPAVPLPPEPSL